MKTLRRVRLLVHALVIASLVIFGQGGAPSARRRRRAAPVPSATHTTRWAA